MPPSAFRSRITHDAAGVDRMPPRPTSTRPTPFAAAILRTIWIASRLKYRPSPPTTSVAPRAARPRRRSTARSSRDIPAAERPRRACEVRTFRASDRRTASVGRCGWSWRIREVRADAEATACELTLHRTRQTYAEDGPGWPAFRLLGVHRPHRSAIRQRRAHTESLPSYVDSPRTRSHRARRTTTILAAAPAAFAIAVAFTAACDKLGSNEPRRSESGGEVDRSFKPAKIKSVKGVPVAEVRTAIVKRLRSAATEADHRGAVEAREEALRAIRRRARSGSMAMVFASVERRR